jgi:hypothetical protein
MALDATFVYTSVCFWVVALLIVYWAANSDKAGAGNETPAATRGVMNYYSHASSTPMQDEILLAPFDCPKNLTQNIKQGVVTGVEVTVHNGRLDRELVSASSCRSPIEVLDTRGMLLNAHSSAVTDFWDQEQITSVHYPEMQRFSQQLTACDRTAVAAHALRGVATEMGRPAAFFVHNDFSDRLKELYLELIDGGERTIVSDPCEDGGLGISADELRTGRLCVINYWRPMSAQPLQRHHLAVIDSTTMQGEEVVRFPHYMAGSKAFGSFSKFFRIPTSPHINVGVRPNPAHKWHYFPGMTRDEVLAFKNYDSAAPQPQRGIGCHTSFDDPNTPPSAPIRESIEIRVLCFWHAP